VKNQATTEEKEAEDSENAYLYTKEDELVALGCWLFGSALAV
jgi:hypothetical protein